ncbi:MAG: ATP-binding protein [Coxiellaceae bacterium]|nr:ATP-binding protein [Coxiellaceae bacterium]
MVLKLTARAEEQEILQKFFTSNQPEFMAIFGRRRIGKTFLIKRFFEKKKCVFFSATGVQNGALTDQIDRFIIELAKTFYQGTELKMPDNWFKVFDMLNDAIEKCVPNNQKVVLFFDEFPWMATHRSKLLSAVEYFWNQYWSDNPRIKLIICGSSASWIIRKIINNKGGLHNRITRKIQLQPFTLKESKTYLSSNGVRLNNKQVLQLYMVTGGVPYYLSLAEKGKSAIQIIEQIAFQRDGILLKEFDNLFSSLFEKQDAYIELIRLIAKYRYGISQEDILKLAKNSSRGGRSVEKLKELEDTGFVVSFIPHFHKKRGVYYRVIDEYCLFYLRWIEPIKTNLQQFSLDSGYWGSEQATPAWISWSGYAFESVCYKHVTQIRKKLQLRPNAVASTWRYQSKPNTDEKGAQIDLLFDRSDKSITLCEIKYSDKPFVINKDYAKNIASKRDVFVKRTKTQKQVFIALIASSGLKGNLYSDDIIDGTVVLDDLFKDNQ